MMDGKTRERKRDLLNYLVGTPEGRAGAARRHAKALLDRERAIMPPEIQHLAPLQAALGVRIDAWTQYEVLVIPTPDYRTVVLLDAENATTIDGFVGFQSEATAEERETVLRAFLLLA